MKRILLATVFCLIGALAVAAPKNYSLSSPDGSLTVAVTLDNCLTYSVAADGVQVIAPSQISMTLSDGTVYGGAVKVQKVLRRSVDESFAAPVYKRSEVRNHFNEMTLRFKTFDLIWRAYDEGVAYRFVSRSAVPFEVASERAEFAFPQDSQAFIPYVSQVGASFEQQFFTSFESPYTINSLSKWESGRLAFMPVLVDAEGGRRVLITEADLLDYPGMFLYNEGTDCSLEGVFAAYPKTFEQGGHNNLQRLVRSRESYIAKAQAGAKFPWRVLVISDNDKDLTASDLVYCLATPPAEKDWSWVRPGKVAWDWWNDWNIDGVDFESGVNTATYKYYIDFASTHGIEYVILDEGWSVNLAADLMQVVPEIDLQEICSYAESKCVSIILWAGYWAFNRDMDQVCKHYAEMGVKGFKVDFMDGDDQEIVDFYVRAAQTAAKYNLMLDFHGAYKPTGLHRTYPNVINFEGVRGLENVKWGATIDQVTYDVTIPFIRMVAGPFDYTQGAMRNATRSNFRALNNEPMSQGTRCRQLAEYVIFDAPFTMLCDTPSAYMREEECTKFIASIPTVWDDTVPVVGKVGEYVAMARKCGDDWYLGALTDWSERDLSLDLSWLPDGQYDVEIFRDGVNAHRIARDYAVQRTTISGSDKSMDIHMAPGGGWVAHFTRR